MSKLSAYFRRRKEKARKAALEKMKKAAYSKSFNKSDNQFKYALTEATQGREAADAAKATNYEGSGAVRENKNNIEDDKLSWYEETIEGMSGSEMEALSKKLSKRFKSVNLTKKQMHDRKEQRVEGTKSNVKQRLKDKDMAKSSVRSASKFSAPGGGIGNQGRSGYSIPKITGGAN